VHRFLPDYFRGSEVYTFKLADEMRRRGHNVLVACLRESQSEKPALFQDEYKKIPVMRILKKIDPADFEKYFFDTQMDKLFFQIVNDFQPDIIHAIYFLGGLSLGMLEQVKEKAPVFITITDYSPLCPRGQLLDKNLKPCPGPRRGIRCLDCLFEKNWVFSHSLLDKIAVNLFPVWISNWKSSDELELIRKRWQAIERILCSAQRVIFAHPHTLKIYQKNKMMVNNPFLLDFGVNFKPYIGHRKTSSARLRIGFIGQILPHKGLHILVSALAQIAQQDDFELIIYGAVELEEEKNYFKSLELDRIKNWRYQGTFDYSEMNKILSGIDLLVVPSLWKENCPLIAKYAILTGTRLYISDQPGILPKINGEGIEVFKNINQLKDKIERLIKSGDWKKPIKPNYELVMNIKEHTQILEKIYQERL